MLSELVREAGEAQPIVHIFTGIRRHRSAAACDSRGSDAAVPRCRSATSCRSRPLLRQRIGVQRHVLIRQAAPRPLLGGVRGTIRQDRCARVPGTPPGGLIHYPEASHRKAGPLFKVGAHLYPSPKFNRRSMRSILRSIYGGAFVWQRNRFSCCRIAFDCAEPGGHFIRSSWYRVAGISYLSNGLEGGGFRVHRP